MKKLLLALGAVTFLSTLCFAEEIAPPPEIETIKGRIDSVATAGGKTQVTIRQEGGYDDGAASVFFIAPDATIIGKDGNAASLNWAKGNRASISYITTLDGAVRTLRTIKSIKLLSDV